MNSEIKGPVVGDTWTPKSNAREYHDLQWFKEALDKIQVRPGVLKNHLPDDEDDEELITTVTNCYESPDDMNCYNHDDSESERGEDMTKVKDPFQSLAPSMAAVYRLIEHESDVSIMKKYINMGVEELMKRKKTRVQTGTGMRSLPELDRRSKDTRKRPANSPR